MSYRQGQMDALYRLGFLKEAFYLPMAVGGATGAALGGTAGYQLAHDENKGMGAVSGALLGGALGAGGVAAIKRDATQQRLQQLAEEMVELRARHGKETGEEMKARLQNIFDRNRALPPVEPPKTVTRDEIQARVENNIRERAKKKPN